MDLFLSIVAFIVIFSFLVLIHEYGHYAMARRMGIKVQEFGIGLPPRLYGFKKNGVLWSINWIPFGGFVRMLGEDPSDKAALKSKESFINKSVGARIKVVVAGVFMNIVLAFILLTIGFIVGMEPLIVDGDDFLAQIKLGNVQYQSGILVKSVEEKSSAFEAEIRPNDRIVAVKAADKTTSFAANFSSLEENFVRNKELSGLIQVVFERDGVIMEKFLTLQNQKSGVAAFPVVEIPSVGIHEVRPGSKAAQAGLKVGDIIVSVNGERVFSNSDFAAYSSTAHKGTSIIYAIIRDNKEMVFEVPLQSVSSSVISKVIFGGPAERSGLKSNDRIITVNGEPVFSPLDVQMKTAQFKGVQTLYGIVRQGLYQEIPVIIDADGFMGVYLSPVTFYENSDLSLYNSMLTVSILDIKDLRYPFYLAPLKTFGEMKRLSYATAMMFGNVLKSILGSAKVPEGVAGPVGIARMTYTFVQEGFASLLRFTALISLSLGVINILPLPALDGGRLIFLVAEGLLGRRLKPEWESRIHAMGFVFLLLLILFVTFNDIKKIFV